MKMTPKTFALFLPGLALALAMLGGSTSFAAAPAELSKPHERNHPTHDLDTSVARSLRTHSDSRQQSPHERHEHMEQRSEHDSQEHSPRQHKQADSPFKKIIGIWEREGYGDVYAIRKDGASLFQITRASCVKSRDYTQDELAELLTTDIEVADNRQSFTATSSLDPSFRLTFRRYPALPDACAPGKLITEATPRRVFEILWHTFNDYYAFFNERGVDWKQRYTDFQARFTDTMDEPALWEALTELLSVIKDGHINLVSSTQAFSADEQAAFITILEDAFAAQSQYTDLSAFMQAQFGRYFATLTTRYLDLDSSVQHASGVVRWGTINNDIGYLSLLGMAGLTSNADASGTTEMLAMQSIMDQVMTDLSDTRAMIIDIRFNSGGYDAVAMAVANRFTDRRRLAMTKTARSYQGETAAKALYLEPEEDDVYLKPVVVIAGPDSVSAAEIFLLAMRALPQVTLIGETSRGIFSDMLGKALPNGWIFTLSNEVYRDHLGVGHEAVGTPPEVPVSVFSLADLDAGRNSALDKALELVGSPVP